MKSSVPVLLFFLIGLFGSRASALPFEADPQGFASFFNTLSWKGGGQRVTLLNPWSCSYRKAGYKQSTTSWGEKVTYYEPDLYKCKGYLRISDPIGHRTCEGRAEWNGGYEGEPPSGAYVCKGDWKTLVFSDRRSDLR